MNVLAIETSCDETAAAVVRDGWRVLSNAVYSQVASHAVFGGVVPEVAARAHVDVLPRLIEKAVADSGVAWGGIDVIAATRGPGLATSLVIGFSAAKALSLRLGLPLMGIHHLEAHLYSILLGDGVDPSLVLPSLVLLVSGGHTCLAVLEGPGRHRLLGQTLDDAAGEALDKGAKMLGMPYPGGPNLEQAGSGGRRDAIAFPRGIPRDDRGGAMRQAGLSFSFSGLKTALLYHLRNDPDAAVPPRLADTAASYEEAVVDTLVTQVEKALDREPVRSIGCAGGVARNRRLRERLAEVGASRGLPVCLAPPDYCTDNAAMIGAIAGALLSSGLPATALHVDIDPNIGLG